jgi:predicted metal-dependent enzyme (double-stranded beta helix superfamily)
MIVMQEDGSTRQRMRAPTNPPPTRLLELADSIDRALNLKGTEMEAAVLAALTTAVTAERWLPSERRRANHEHYARHLLYGDPSGRFSILAIVWDQGQTSPCHGHLTWCAMGVYDNALLETRYLEQPDGSIEEHSVEVREQGSCTFDAALSAIHCISNHRTTPTVSLHIYGIAADQVTTSINKLYRR